jgi:hypothetical protein
MIPNKARATAGAQSCARQRRGRGQSLARRPAGGPAPSPAARACRCEAFGGVSAAWSRKRLAFSIQAPITGVDIAKPFRVATWERPRPQPHTSAARVASSSLAERIGRPSRAAETRPARIGFGRVVALRHSQPIRFIPDSRIRRGLSCAARATELVDSYHAGAHRLGRRGATRPA